MNKLQVVLLALAFVAIIAGGIVLNTDVALAGLCGTPCSVYDCPAQCPTCDVSRWCCNGTIYVRCKLEPTICQYAWCQS